MRTILGFGSDLLGAAADSPATADLPGVQKAAELVKPEPKHESMAVRLKDLGMRGGAGIAGAVAGAVLWPAHRVLGIIAGSSLGMNAPGLLKKEERLMSAACVATDAAAVGGALAWKKHPVVGFILGGVLGGAVSKYASENDHVQKWLGVK